MILPTKGIAPDRAILTVGAELLRLLDESKTISRLWEEISRRRSPVVGAVSFDWFVLALDFLYAANAVDLVKGRVYRSVAPLPVGDEHAQEEAK